MSKGAKSLIMLWGIACGYFLSLYYFTVPTAIIGVLAIFVAASVRIYQLENRTS